MEILIQGSKEGYKILHKTLNFPSNFAEDSRIEDVENNRSTVGKITYSISMSNNGTIFSTSKGIWDLKRKAIGTINFSVFIPSNKKLKSEELKSLLDELSNKYWYNYIEDGNLSIDREDWSQFIAIAKEFEDKLITIAHEDIESYQQGSRNAAYIYYANNEELLKFFEYPFQDEYRSFKHVYLVDQQFEGKSENPLNALRHDSNANLTGKISLENPKFKLLFNQNAKGGINIEIRVNGSLRYNKDKVKRNDTLEITWSKKFSEPLIEKGKCFELSNHLDINENEKTITIRENVELKQQSHTFIIEILDQTSTPIKDATLFYQIGNGPIKNQKDYQLVFTSEDLQHTCFLYAQKGALYSVRKELTCENSLTPIKLKLQEERNITISVKNESGLQLQNWTIQNALTDRNTGLKNTPSNGIVKLVGDEIFKKWTLVITHSDYSFDKPIKDIEFSDENYKTLLLSNDGLVKSQQNTAKKYRIKIDTKKGVDKKKINGELIDYEPTKDAVEPNFGYKFLRWDTKPNTFNSNEQTCEAIFEKVWYKDLGGYVLFFVLIFSIIIGVQYWNEEPIDVTTSDDKISNYVKGIELNLDTLNSYKANCTNTSKNCDKLNNAIEIRNAIKEGDIDRLFNLEYSEEQNIFKNVIDSIFNLTDSKKNILKSRLINQSKNDMTLIEIVRLIRDNSNSTSGGTNGGGTNGGGTNGGVNPNDIIELISEFKKLNSNEDSKIGSYQSLLSRYRNRVKTGPALEKLKKICKYTPTQFKDFVEEAVITKNTGIK